MDTDTAVIGLDFGSLSCRGVLVSPADGRILAEAVRPYEHGVLGCLPDGSPVPEGFVLQDPRDFTVAMSGTVRDLMNVSDARGVLVYAEEHLQPVAERVLAHAERVVGVSLVAVLLRADTRKEHHRRKNHDYLLHIIHCFLDYYSKITHRVQNANIQKDTES